MPAAQYDITIEQGVDYHLDISWLDSENAAMPLDDYEFASQVREDYASPSAMSFELEVADDLISLHAPSSSTSALDFSFGVWDLEATHTASGEVVRLVQGRAEISREVTR